MGTGRSKTADEIAQDETTTIEIGKPGNERKAVKTAWPILTQILLVLYGLVFLVYAAWPITLFNINMGTWPVLNFFVSLSITKLLVPILGIFMAMMQLIYPDLLGLYLVVIVLALIDSLFIILYLAIDMIRANSQSGNLSYANDLLYCCKYAGIVASCPSSSGPCPDFSGILRINSDSIVLMVFQCIFFVLEILCIIFMVALYNTHVEKSKKLNWKRLVSLVKNQKNTQQMIQNIYHGSGATLQKMPVWKEQIELKLSSLVYHTPPNKRAKMD